MVRVCFKKCLVIDFQKWTDRSHIKSATSETALQSKIFSVGIQTTIIRFDESVNEWRLTVDGRPSQPFGFSTAPQNTYLLGKSQWFISNDGISPI